MRVLVFGKTGQVATELSLQIPIGVEMTSLGRTQADLSNPAACVTAIEAARPDLVINAAAYTAVDHAEENEALATVINGDVPTAMAQACTRLDIPFLHVSTDYVFEGGGTKPWAEGDKTSPQNAYGRSKLIGEEGVRAAKGRYTILRTSWVFSAHGANFVKTMLRLADTRDRLAIVADQVGGPTPAADIATALWKMADALYQGKGTAGTYHYSGVPDVSWADFAREIFDQAKRVVEVEDIATSDYPTPATRPLNSRLECSAIYDAFGITRPDWRAGLAGVLKNLKEAAT